jgi:hypothetical protein
MLKVEGRAVLFGFQPTPVDVSILPRSRGWRAAGTAQVIGVSLVVAPIVAFVPPHAPWAIGALAAGAIFGRRRWQETHTLMELAGACPKCAAPFHLRPGRLRAPHPLQCEACHHVSALELPSAALA